MTELHPDLSKPVRRPGSPVRPISYRAESGLSNTEISPIERTRDEIRTSFKDAYSFMKSEGVGGKLLPQEQEKLKIMEEYVGEIIDKDKSYITVKSTDAKDPSLQYGTREGIPVDGLIAFIQRKLSEDTLNIDTKKQLEKSLIVLLDNKKLFHQRKKPIVYQARVYKERDAIAADPSRTTGDAKKDYDKAAKELEEREELVFPSKTKQPKTPLPTPKPEPTPAPVEPSEPSSPEPAPLPVPEPSPEPTPEPIPTPEPKPPEEVRREIVVANRSGDLFKRAREVAEDKLRGMLRSRNIFRSIKYRLAEEYYRQKFTRQAYSAMLENNNAYLEMDAVRSRLRMGRNLEVRNASANQADEVSAGSAKVDQVKMGETFAGEHITRLAEGPLRDAIIRDIISPSIRGEIADRGELQQRLRSFISVHESDPIVRELFGSDATQYGRIAEYFATDLLEMSQVVQTDIAANKYTLETMDRHIDVTFANMNWAADTNGSLGGIDLSRTDRFVRWAQRRKLTGAIFNPAVIGAGSSLATF
ncbi:MAG: hypothetical protein AAB966_00425, partial [Patescibacteria group bacterium]